MSLQEKFVTAYVVMRHGGVALHFHVVHKQHGFAVGQKILNFFSCHHNFELLIAEYSPLVPSRRAGYNMGRTRRLAP